MMRAAFLVDKEKMIIKKIEKPICSDEKVLIRIKEVGICGSDIRYYKTGIIGNKRISRPIILGHECSGVIEEVGRNVTGFSPGERVAIEPGIPCNRCEYCRKGKYNLCPYMSFLGTHKRSGAFTKYIEYSPNYLYKIPEHLDFTEGALMEPFSVALQCLRVTEKLGIDMCLLGCGPIGLAILELSRVGGVSNVYVSEVNDYRLDIAREHNATLTINPKRQNLTRIIRKYTNNEGVDTAIDAAGSESSINSSLKIVKKGGKVIWVSIGIEKIQIPFSYILRKCITIFGIYRYENTFSYISKLIDNNRIDFKNYVSHRFDFSEIGKAFDIASDPKGNTMKIIIEM